MKTICSVGLCLVVLLVSGCATYSGPEQRAVVGTAIAVVVIGAAVHGAKSDSHSQ